MRRDRERLEDILEAIAQIERYVQFGYERFSCDELVQVWTIHHLQIIGEASRSLSPSLIQSYPEIPWAEIIAFRNLLVHEYFKVNLNIVWRIV